MQWVQKNSSVAADCFRMVWHSLIMRIDLSMKVLLRWLHSLLF